jgi:hypothetical protein
MSWAVADDKVLLGVLEEPQCANAKIVRGRIMFGSDGARWESLASRDAGPNATGIRWTVALDGKSVGTLALEDSMPGSPKPTDWFYSRDRLFVPVGNYPSPNNGGAFAGWCEAPSRRPLVLISRPMVADPSAWKPAPSTKDYRDKLYRPMKLVTGRTSVYRCRDSEGAKPEPFNFGPEDLKIYKVYRSKTGSTLVSIGLTREKNGCDGPMESVWWDQWFLLQDETIDFIGNGMELVDAGDYDGDGRSELLFWHSGYNRDGYVLVFDDLRQKVEYTWSYH